MIGPALAAAVIGNRHIALFAAFGLMDLDDTFFQANVIQLNAGQF
jgi:hypothetical protein